MSTFPGMSMNDILWKMTLPQVMMMFERAIEVKTGDFDTSDPDEPEPDLTEYEWKEEDGD